MSEVRYINTNDKLSELLFSFYFRNQKQDYRHTAIVDPRFSPLVPRKFIIQKKNIHNDKLTNIFYIVWEELFLKGKDSESDKIIVEIKFLDINDQSVIHKQMIDSISHHFHELDSALLNLCV